MNRPHREYHEANRTSWNAATQAHNSHKGDQARALASGHDTLFDEELELLGALRGKRLAHLQCNSGQDTLCLARRGAIVTGVDISDEAIAFAQKLSSESRIAATFVRSDLFDWFEQASARGESYDIVFSSYGTYGWISDLRVWARGIASILAPNGCFVLVDFHPVAWIFDRALKPTYPYSGGILIPEDGGVGDYVAVAKESLVPWGFEAGETQFVNPHPAHGFAWGMADVIDALASAGLKIETFREYRHSNGAQLFDEMRAIDGRRFALPEGAIDIPLMFGIRAGR